jgi:thiol-disulfide isomerase/thioredoxin
MNKKILAIVGLITVIASAAITFSALNKGEMAKESSNTNTSNTTDTTPDVPTATTGAYVDYYDGVIADTAGTKILFFHAPWCPQCRALEASIKNDGVPNGVTIIKVDYDSSRNLRQKYGVTIQTTLVRVDDDGNEVKKYVAYDQPNIESVRANLL